LFCQDTGEQRRVAVSGEEGNGSVHDFRLLSGCRSADSSASLG
jgi:hypothetical protein